MPQYTITHSHPLTPTQHHLLVTSLTTLHCTLFSAPSAFVNISFHHGPPSSTPTTFVGGRPVATNAITGHLRPRGPDNREKLSTLVREIGRLWDLHVRLADGDVDGGVKGEGKMYRAQGRLDDARALHNVFIMEDIVAGAEQGFELPVAGRDGEWVGEQRAEMERRVEEGDESMRALLEEADARLGKRREDV